MNDLFNLFIFLVVALVPGTAESDPSTEGVFFKVPVVADNITGVEFGPGYTIKVHIEPSKEYQSVSVHIPKGLPVAHNSGLGYFLRDYPDLGHQHDPEIYYGYYWDTFSYTADAAGTAGVGGGRPPGRRTMTNTLSTRPRNAIRSTPLWRLPTPRAFCTSTSFSLPASSRDHRPCRSSHPRSPTAAPMR